jgi:hypothetical protein
MTIPGKGHEDIRDGQKKDCSHVFALSPYANGFGKTPLRGSKTQAENWVRSNPLAARRRLYRSSLP